MNRSLENKVVLVASTSKQKLNAVRRAFERANINAEIIGKKAPSEINEQPIGYEETKLGALNRAKNAVVRLQREDNRKPDIVFGIESGLLHEDELGDEQVYGVIRNGDLIDVGIILMADMQNVPDVDNIKDYIVEERTEGVVFPGEYISVAQQIGFDTTTVGSIIKRNHPEVDDTDPQIFLTNGEASRADLLEKAVFQLLERYLQGE